ncbi:MAG: hypothetical protein ABI142_13205 [Bryocella sp.]
MTRNLMQVVVVTVVLLLAGVAFSPVSAAQTQKTAEQIRPGKKLAKESKLEREIRELREQLLVQQAQINALQAALASRVVEKASDQKSEADARQRTAEAAKSAQRTLVAAQSTAAKAEALQQQVRTAQVAEAKQRDADTAETQEIKAEVESPAALRYKGVTITPVGFFAFEGVWRQHALNSDINTPFNSIPFPSAAEGHVSELNFSGRQTRLGGVFDASAGNTRLTAYFESDFLGVGTTSNDNQSNSYALRVRQAWGRAQLQNGFGVSGGQMWSLVTEDGKGVENRTEKSPQSVDSQFVVGFSWTRQAALRVWQRWGAPTSQFTAAISLEQAQITNFTVNGTAPTNYFFSAGGSNGGAFNAAANPSGAYLATYTNNVAPDVVVKGALDLPKAHLEIGGLARWMRNYYNPVSVVSGAYVYDTSQQRSNTKFAGGVFASARVSPNRHVNFEVQAMAGDGVGRYGTAQLTDATLRPDQTLEPIRNYHGLAGIETRPAKKLEAYVYYGGEYAQRTVYANGLGGQMGYGIYTNNNGSCYDLPVTNSTTAGSGSGGNAAPKFCGGPTRYIQEAMGGITYHAIQSPKWGQLQYQLVFSYIQRNLWSGIGSTTTPTGPRATEPMVHVSMRYIIP